MNDHSDQEILPSEEEEEIEYENASTADGVATGFSNNRSLPVVPALVSFW
jgi:hypothetical protein